MSAASLGASDFFRSFRWPAVAIVVLTGFSAMAFGPRLFLFLMEGTWSRAETPAFLFAPVSLNIHALFGMAILPLFFLQPILGRKLAISKTAPRIGPAHRWIGRFLTLSAIGLSFLGFYITYIFVTNTDSNATAMVFIFLVALCVLIFFAQAVREAWRGHIEGHVDAIVCAMIYLSIPGIGRTIEAAMRGLGIEDTRSRDVIVPVGFDRYLELVEITVLLNAAIPIVFWLLYAMPRGVVRRHPVKLSVAGAFLALPTATIALALAGR